MLAASIICFFGEIAFYIIGMVNLGLNPDKAPPIYSVMTTLMWICVAIAAVGIPLGIKGIRNKKTRGLSIATTAVSSLDALIGFILGLIMLVFLFTWGSFSY